MTVTLESLKKRVTNLVTKRGYVLTDELDDVKQLKIEDWRLFFDWLEEAKVPIKTREDAYLDQLKTKRARIDFCYFVFVCRFFHRSQQVDAYDRAVISLQKKAIDDYIEKECNDFQKTILRLKFGLDTGVPSLNEEELFHSSGIPYMDAFIREYANALMVMEYGYYRHRDLERTLRTIEMESQIKGYVCDEVKIDDDTGVLFRPKNDDSSKAGGFLAFYPEDKARQIGWLKGPGYFAHSITFYGDRVWGLRFFNTKKPSLHIHYEGGRLYFEVYYSGIGYHGRRYIVESGKNVIIEEYKKGTKIASTEIDFRLEADLDNLFTLSEFGADAVEVVKTRGEIAYQTCEAFGELRPTFKVKYENGMAVIGEAGDEGFEGAVLVRFPSTNQFGYMSAHKGEINKKGPLIEVERGEYPQAVRFELRNKAGNRCVFRFDPDSNTEELIFAEYSDKNQLLNSANLSNPFFKKPVVKEMPVDSSDDPEAALNKLIGLANVKKQIVRLKALLRKDNAKKDPINLNIVFSGNPGTGKTIVARLLGSILFKEGILPENKFVEVDRSMIVGRYVGQTENHVKELIESAMGGVLFVDEAYSLYTEWGESGDDYGKQALDTFVKAMEDYRGKICFIFAGYKEPMLRLIGMNQGFKSRVNRFIDFPNYSLEELKLIATKMATDNEYSLGEGVLDAIAEIIEPTMKDDDFANARDIRNILESLYEIQAVRTYEDTRDTLITLADVNDYKEDIHFTSPEQKARDSINLAAIQDAQNQPTCLEIAERYIQESSVNIKIMSEGELVAEGSGFFITPDGLIGTCAHVVKDAKDIKVSVNIFTNKGKCVTKLYDALLIALDEDADVALIKISDPDIEFSYYKLAKEDFQLQLLSPVAMGGYPLGGERFRTISMNEGKIQSFNNDARIDAKTNTSIERIYVDLTGHSGNSGSGVLSLETGECIGVYAGGSLGYSGRVVMKLNYAIHIKYLWKLISSLAPKQDEQ